MQRTGTVSCFSILNTGATSGAVPALPETLPRVTIQLPLYNELYVVERLITAAAQLAYPRELLQIQVLDDSTDETSERARNLVA